MFAKQWYSHIHSFNQPVSQSAPFEVKTHFQQTNKYKM